MWKQETNSLFAEPSKSTTKMALATEPPARRQDVRWSHPTPRKGSTAYLSHPSHPPKGVRRRQLLLDPAKKHLDEQGLNQWSKFWSSRRSTLQVGKAKPASSGPALLLLPAVDKVTSAFADQDEPKAADRLGNTKSGLRGRTPS